MGYVPVISPNQDTTEVVRTLVSEKFAATSLYASDAYDKAISFLDSIIGLINNISDVNTDITLDEINLDPSINITSYLRNIPVPPIFIYPTLPTDSFSYTEDNYISSLLDLLKTKLTSILNGVSILDPSVENAIFNRESERDKLVLQDTKDRIASDWSERGFDLPGGGLFNALLQTDVEYQNKKLDKSRTIAEETRKIEVENIRTSIQESRQIENVLMDYKSKYWDRKLQAAKYIVDQAIVIFNAAVELIKTKANVYSTEVSAFASFIGALVSAANVEIAVIKGKVDYAVADGNLKVEIVKARIEEMKASVGLALQATDAGSRVAAQLAASALSAVSAGASLSVGNTQAINSAIEASERWQHNIEEES